MSDISLGLARKSKIVCIVGPTAARKSRIALTLAEALGLNAAIISADAFQAYRELNVGVNKPSLLQRSKIVHHFVDCVSIDEEWNVSRFCSLAHPLIAEISQSGGVPIVCGGSHLYADALTKNFSFGSVGPRDEREYDGLTTEAIYARLFKINPEAAQKIGVNNRRRLTRSLQISSAENAKVTQNLQNKNKYDVFRIVCCPRNRSELYTAINTRVHQMLAFGWKNEVADLLRRYPNFLELPASKAAGYSLVASAVIKGGNPDAQEIATQTRQLAKRQMSWCRSHYTEDSDIWFDPFLDDIYYLLNRLKPFLSEKTDAKFS